MKQRQITVEVLDEDLLHYTIVLPNNQHIRLPHTHFPLCITPEERDLYITTGAVAAVKSIKKRLDCSISLALHTLNEARFGSSTIRSYEQFHKSERFAELREDNERVFNEVFNEGQTQ